MVKIVGFECEDEDVVCKNIGIAKKHMTRHGMS